MLAGGGSWPGGRVGWRGVLGCWVLGSGGVACSRAAHDALGETARDNDLLALLVHLGAARGQFRGLTFEGRHPGNVRLAEGRSFASVHRHSAARERRRHGRRSGRAPARTGQGLPHRAHLPTQESCKKHFSLQLDSTVNGYLPQQQLSCAAARCSPAK